MRVAEKITPVLAALSAVSTLACCLPIAGATFLGIGTVFGALAAYQTWMLPISGILLAAGGAQIWRSRRECQRTSKFSVIVLGTSAVIVVLVAFFPQLVAGLLTDWFS
jgi:cytochrome bd-type quinol oxidase subunit 2